MHPLRTLVTVSLLLGAMSICMTPVAVSAGTITPALEAELANLPPGGQAIAMVILKEQAPIRELDHELNLRGASRAERHETIVRALQETAAASQLDLRASLDAGLRAGAIARYRTYWILNAALVLASADAIRGLAARPDVAEVRTNPRPELIAPVGHRDPNENMRGIGITPGQRAIGADRVWKELGITGAGTIVSELDTGVDGNHPALRDRWRGNNGHPWQECWLDVLGGDTQYPYDDGQHGTHTMGTLCGMSSTTGDTIGVAWGAQWIECNVIGGNIGSEFDSDVTIAYQWIADPDGDPATVLDVPDVCQNSWGIDSRFGGDYQDCDYRWQEVIDNCEAAGVAVTFSSGNEGPDPQTHRSPANICNAPTVNFAVGAVDATNYSWPYPIADFSSRGPSDCDGITIKPEVSAPGVDVYSSIPGGGYAQAGWSGTSMAGPHVAGIIALMREANPDLDVTTMKEILIDTARDEGAAGEDNDYGFGFVDAYAAVTIALQGTGVLQGSVSNASNGGTPIPGAVVSLRGSAAQYPTGNDGLYRGHALAGSYMAVVSHPSFAPDSALVVITTDGVAAQDFSLADIAPPVIANVSDPLTIPDAVGPYAISATITDLSAIDAAILWYRVQNGPWLDVPMNGDGGLFTGLIPGSPAGSRIDFYLAASDIAGNASSFPPDAPNTYRSFYVTIPVLIDDAEGDQHWMLSWGGDTATDGFWVREDPVGTHVGQQWANPEDDHTPDPGHICFVTENGAPGGNAGANDVDGGCASVVTPVMDLSGATEAFVYYSRWYAQFGIAGGDNFTVQVSTNNGLTWVEIEALTSRQNQWTERFLRLSDYATPTATVRLRFRVCDLQTDSVVEGGVDDVRVEALPPLGSQVDGGPIVGGAALGPARPNPARAFARILFRLASPADARLDLYDAAGRHVRTLASGRLTAGPHEVEWDGRDDGGSRAAPGVYFYRLKTSGFEESSRIVLVP